MLPRYQRIALSLRQAIIAGALHPGDRLLSVRKLAEREQVSIPTAQEALRFLEAEGLIVARPRSGYYVSLVTPAAASGAVPNAAPVSVDMSTLARTLFSGQESRLVPPGAAQPDPAWLPAAGCSGFYSPQAAVWRPAGRPTACRREEPICVIR